MSTNSNTTGALVGRGATMYDRLLKRIKAHSGMDDDRIIDAGAHGADAGWPGFTYTSDTVAFFKANRADIQKLVQERADDLGETPLEMVAGFRCLGGTDANLARLRSGNDRDGRHALAEYYPSVSKCLYGGRLNDDDHNVANALAWFALEEVGRWLESNREQAGE